MNKQRWKLQIYWAGDWRTIMESDERQNLVEYAQRCADDARLRIFDSEEKEGGKHGRRRD